MKQQESAEYYRKMLAELEPEAAELDRQVNEAIHDSWSLKMTEQKNIEAQLDDTLKRLHLVRSRIATCRRNLGL